jgi:hypothetical protein
MTSPQSPREVSSNVSWVNVTPPSIEFSIGTTPKSASRRDTASNTAGIDAAAVSTTASPKWAETAS